MVTVNIWWPKWGNIGHASAHVGDVYISNWPGELSSVFYWGKGALNTYAADVSSEGGSPNFRKNVGGLNEGDILAWWDSFKINPAYSLLFLNCMQTVATALSVGSPNPLHTRHTAIRINNHYTLWLFANSMAASPWSPI